LLTAVWGCSAAGAAVSSKLNKSISSEAAAAVAAGGAGTGAGAEMPLKDTLAGLAMGDVVPLDALTGDEGPSELADALSEAWAAAVGDATDAGVSACCMKG